MCDVCKHEFNDHNHMSICYNVGKITDGHMLRINARCCYQWLSLCNMKSQLTSHFSIGNYFLISEFHNKVLHNTWQFLGRDFLGKAVRMSGSCSWLGLFTLQHVKHGLNPREQNSECDFCFNGSTEEGVIMCFSILPSVSQILMTVFLHEQDMGEAKT